MRMDGDGDGTWESETVGFNRASVDIELQPAGAGSEQPYAPLATSEVFSPDNSPPRSIASTFVRKAALPAGALSQVTDEYYRRWYRAHRIRKHFQASEVWSLPWYQRPLWFLELPVTLLRDFTIPTLEEAAWSKHVAMAHPVCIAGLCLWVFRLPFTVTSTISIMHLCNSHWWNIPYHAK